MSGFLVVSACVGGCGVVGLINRRSVSCWLVGGLVVGDILCVTTWVVCG